MSDNDNGRKPSSEQQCNECGNDQRPWWHSGSHCLAALLWCFTLAVAWRGTFGAEGMTWPVIGTFALGLVLAVVQSSMASVKGKGQ